MTDGRDQEISDLKARLMALEGQRGASHGKAKPKAKMGLVAKGVLAVLGFIVVAGVLGSLFQSSTPTASQSTNQSSQPGDDDKSVPEPWLQDMAKQYAGPYLNLKDPDSAIYTNTTYRTRHSEPYICGFVNAKNGFGAYVGPRAFIIGGGTTLIEGRTSNKRLKQAWQRECLDTDASDRLVVKKEQPTPGGVAPGDIAKLKPLFSLTENQSVSFTRVTYRTRYGVPVTCGNVSIDGNPPFRFIKSSVGLSREDKFEGSKSEFDDTWRELCAVTDAQQDAEDAKWDRPHRRHRGNTR
ncbi:MAG TPA: hypothetical protein VGF71_10365 [Caulobacteraceae bacterium]|jgi:hypothetical protein